MLQQESRRSRPAVWIDDSNPIFRTGLGAVLHSEGVQIVGQTAPTQPPPCLVDVDVLLFEAEHGGVQRAAAMTRSLNCKLIAMVREPHEQLVLDALSARASAVLIRSTLTTRSLVNAVHSATHDEITSLPAHVVAQLLEQATETRAKVPHRLDEREVNVLRFLSEGHETREIATNMGYSERTVKNVVHDLLMKMNCRNRTHAVATAARVGLI